MDRDRTKEGRGGVEILSPAGSMEALKAAVRCGADAVYLGAAQFSARGNAQNFGRDALRQAVEYCHLAGVKVHLAVNTLLFDRELKTALELVRYACTLPVDAVIVQDWGLFRLLRRAAPELPLHASTQMSAHTPAGVRLLAEQGAARVVLARELSLKEIRQIAGSTDVDLEHFIHGALCMCVSGQCYFSAMLGSRSGNRGFCAQPCRLPFAAKGGTGRDLSLKDLSAISQIDALREAGVCSCKIEGRMKRPEYVAAATAACRLAADGQSIPPDLLHDLEAVFSRSGFTTGYPDGKLGREMFGTRTYEDVAGATEKVLAGLRARCRAEAPRVPVAMDVTIAPGKAASLTLSDGDGNTVTVTGEAAEPARQRSLDPERCKGQLTKTGGTVFRVAAYRADIAPGSALPVSALNALRRDGLEQLSALRQRRPAIPFAMPALDAPPHVPQAKMALRADFSAVPDAGRIPDEARGCELVFVSLSTKEDVLRALLERGFSLGVALPRGMFGREDAVRRALETAANLGVRHGWTGNIGGVPLLKESGMAVHGGFSLNAANTQSVAFLESLGLCDTELSPELTLSQAAAVGGKLPRGLVAYGRLPLMLTRNCPAANHPGGCKGCEHRSGSRPALLTDRKGARFPIACDGGCSTVYNSVPLLWSDRLGEIAGQDFLALRFTTESPAETVEVLAAYREGAPVDIPFTRGLYRRGVG